MTNIRYSLSNAFLFGLVIVVFSGCYARAPKVWETKDGVFIHTRSGGWIVVVGGDDVSKLLNLSAKDRLSINYCLYVAFKGFTSTGGGNFIDGELVYQRIPLCFIYPAEDPAELRIYDYVIYSRQTKKSVHLSIQPTARTITWSKPFDMSGATEREGPAGILYVEAAAKNAATGNYGKLGTKLGH
jgi:hypothetical protein